MTDNDHEQQMKALADEVLRNIGCNVIVFQQIEVMLKYLVAYSHVEGDATNLQDIQKKKTDKVNKQMLGELVKQYTSVILLDAGEPLDEPDEDEPTDEADGFEIPYVRAKFTMTCTQEFYDKLLADMKIMVDERNDLIHHFLPRWRSQTIESLQEASEYLEAQRAKVRPMYDHLDSVMKHRQMAVEFMGSEAFRENFELVWLQNSQIISFMKDVSTQFHRPDGWTYLALAGKLARKEILDDVVHMEEHYGHKTFKQLLIASEMFDVFDEPLLNGKFRTVYRVKKVVQH